MLAGVLWALLAGTAPASADVLVPRKGKKVEGAIVKQDDGEVVLNRYWSRNPGVTNPDHLVRYPADRVKRVDLVPRPEVEVYRRLDACADDDVDELLAIGAYAKEHKLKAEASMAFARALAADPSNLDAIKGIGGRAKWASVKKGNPRLDPALQDALKRYVAEADPAARVKLASDLKDAGYPAKPEALERYRRSSHQPTGYVRDRPLSYRSDQHPGAVYTLYVPTSYEPTRTWPLIIGLHGGGPDGKSADEVVGSGPSAMNFYQQPAARHGYIVACPTALSAGWGSNDNEEMVRDVITELRLLYNVDIDRIYLTGHSMGGFGTWALGPRLAEDLAAVSPMAGGGGSGGGKLVATKTPIFIFHSSDDAVVGPSSDRAAAKSLLGSGHDFVYTELPDAGHGFPDSVRNELFAFFGPRRRFDKKRKTAWPRSSFHVKVTKDETKYLGDPMMHVDGTAPDLKSLVADLRLGGGKAAAAVTRIVALQVADEAVGPVAKVAGNAGLPFDARAYAARTLGRLGLSAGLSALRKVVALPAEKQQSMVAVEAAKALSALKQEDGQDALLRAIEQWCGYYESKLMGEQMRYSDWRRSINTLAALVRAFADLATSESAVKRLEKNVVARVFEAKTQVETSSRVPQDPNAARKRLAAAVGAAYAVAGANDDAWARLAASLDNDPSAQAAAQSERR